MAGLKLTTINNCNILSILSTIFMTNPENKNADAKAPTPPKIGLTHGEEDQRRVLRQALGEGTDQEIDSALSGALSNKNVESVKKTETAVSKPQSGNLAFEAETKSAIESIGVLISGGQIEKGAERLVLFLKAHPQRISIIAKGIEQILNNLRSGGHYPTMAMVMEKLDKAGFSRLIKITSV
jgi:hypothetical protein